MVFACLFCLFFLAPSCPVPAHLPEADKNASRGESFVHVCPLPDTDFFFVLCRLADRFDLLSVRSFGVLETAWMVIFLRNGRRLLVKCLGVQTTAIDDFCHFR